MDVEAYIPKVFYKNEYEYFKKSPPEAFSFDVEEVLKYKGLQNETSLKVWFAVMPVHDNIVANEIYFIPLDRIDKFMMQRHYAKKWPYVQVPKPCFTDCSRLAYNICVRCRHKYCEEIVELIKLYEEVNLKE